MNADEYLEELSRKLKDYPRAQREEFLNEIASHIESGGEDPGQGKDPLEREQRVMAEMGSPEHMEGGLRRVHRRSRWIDLLLVLFALLPLMQMVANVQTGQMIRSLPQQPFVPPFGIDIMLYQPLWMAGMALFFLLQQRETHAGWGCCWW
jgi:hypothetical protein